ncbi:hypothetical protein [Kordia sp.]|uniref:hypothetical protein n=1 Tax=Kordia sp. TaxID=1965332 RepID=UPI003D6B077F
MSLKNTINNSGESAQEDNSLFEHAIHQQHYQFQIGIDNLKNEIEKVSQLKSKLSPIVGNRTSRFYNDKNKS